MAKRVVGIFMVKSEWVKLRKLDHAKKCFDRATSKLSKDFKKPNTWIKRDSDTLEDWIQCVRNLKSNGIKFEIVDITIETQIRIDYENAEIK